jgi:hypothetical protein
LLAGTSGRTGNYTKEATMAKCSPFHTSEPETPEVYHDDDDCWAGKNILSEHRVEGPGVNRERCEICEGLAA